MKINTVLLLLIFFNFNIFAQNSNEYLNVDNKIFPEIYWGTKKEVILDMFGTPSSEYEDDNYWHMLYPGPNIGNMHTALMLNIHKVEMTLDCIQLVFLDSYVFPEMYIRDFSIIEQFLDTQYPAPNDQGFDWYSIKEEPQFTGEEILNNELAMITTRDIGNSIVSHSIMYSDDHINHIISYVTINKRSRFVIIDEFASAFNQLINE